jgi:glycerophosphoryl diester phosphodiesterase
MRYSARSNLHAALMIILAIIFTFAVNLNATTQHHAPDGSFTLTAMKTHKSECQKTTDHSKWCKKVKDCGHRGIQNEYEDTLWALRRAHRLGVCMEADQVTLADGTLVVHHDMAVGRVESQACMDRAGVTPGTPIITMTRAQWDKLCTKGEHPKSLPTLKQFIELDGKLRVPVMMERKYTIKDPQQVADWIERYDAPMTFYGIQRFDKFHHSCSDTPNTNLMQVGLTVGIKTDGNCRPSLQAIHDAGYRYVITSNTLLTGPYVKQAHELGLKAGFFDSGSRATWTASVNVKVDIFIAPHPGRAKKWLVGTN